MYSILSYKGGKMNQKFRVVIVENGCKRSVEINLTYDQALSFKRKWKASNPNDQLVIQPINPWER